MADTPDDPKDPQGGKDPQGSDPADKARRSPTPPPPRPGKGGARPRPGQGGNRPRSGSAGGRNSAANRRAAVAQERRRKQTILGALSVGVVLIVVVVFVIVKVTGGSSTKTATTSSLGHTHGKAVTALEAAPVPAFVYSGFKSVTPATLAAAAKNAQVADLTDPKVTNDPPTSATGKPQILYVGAEYCPYCATERWPLVLALSQFGTFHHLSSTTSTSKDVDPNTPTFTFYKSTYTSPYFDFVPVETATRDEQPLQKLTAAQQKLLAKYDVVDGQAGSIPFVYLNGKAIITGAEYDPSVLKSGDFVADAKSVIAGTSTLASAVYADAGAIVSDLCRVTGGKPGNVCKAFPTPISR